MKYLYSGTSAIGVPKMAKERTGVAQPGTQWLRAWMVGAEAQAVPMMNLSALMTFRLGPEQSYGMRCHWDLSSPMACDVIGTWADAMTKSAGTGRDLMGTSELVCLQGS